MPLISVCVCTYKRPAGLSKLLATLAAMRRPADCQVEVLVVDNDASASAMPCVDAARAGFPIALRYFCETRSGVGFARSRCLREAKGDWIAFIDDDEWAEPQWLSDLWHCLLSGGYDGVFGPVLASFEVEPPTWLVDSGVYDRPRRPTGERLDWPDCASGNVILSKDLATKVGDFSPAFAASGGEDSEYFWRCLDAGATFVWCDTAIAHENIPPARMTRRWVRRRAYVAGHNYTRLKASRQGPRAYAVAAMRGLAAVLAFGCRALVARLMSDPQSLAYEAKVAGGLGKLMAVASPAQTEYGSPADTAPHF